MKYKKYTNLNKMMKLTVEDYSERSFVVYGEDTKKYKDKLKEFGGKYNPNLSVGVGWIFGKKNREKVDNWMNGEEEDGVKETSNEIKYEELRTENVRLQKINDELNMEIKRLNKMLDFSDYKSKC